MNLLSIDTSSAAGSILLSDSEGILGEINLDSSQTHSTRLLGGIDYLLKHSGLPLSDVEAFAVISGPGSFTGVRIGLTTVKALAQTTNKPILAVNSFEAWAEKFPNYQGILIPLIDARREEVYGSVLKRTADQLIQISDGHVRKIADVISGISFERILFVGSGAQKYRHLLVNNGHPGWTVEHTDSFLGRPMARVALRKAKSAEFTSAGDLAAYYVRKSDAELNWKEK